MFWYFKWETRSSDRVFYLLLLGFVKNDRLGEPDYPRSCVLPELLPISDTLRFP